MKVLLINGSPHTRGCTYTALSAVADTLEKNEIETEMFHIGNGPVHGCIGCGKCGKTHTCVFDDDGVNRAIEKAADADGFVFGCPVHYASPNGAMISFMDRFWMASSAMSYKPAACVVSARRAGTTASLDALLKYPSFKHMPIVTAQYWNMVHGNTPQEVRQDEEGMQIMRTIGNNMAWLLNCIQAGKKVGIQPPEAEEKIKTSYIR